MLIVKETNGMAAEFVSWPVFTAGEVVQTTTNATYGRSKDEQNQSYRRHYAQFRNAHYPQQPEPGPGVDGSVCIKCAGGVVIGCCLADGRRPKPSGNEHHDSIKEAYDSDVAGIRFARDGQHEGDGSKGPDDR